MCVHMHTLKNKKIYMFYWPTLKQILLFSELAHFSDEIFKKSTVGKKEEQKAEQRSHFI